MAVSGNALTNKQKLAYLNVKMMQNVPNMEKRSNGTSDTLTNMVHMYFNVINKYIHDL